MQPSHCHSPAARGEPVASLRKPTTAVRFLQAEGALGAMQALGWVASEEDADMLVLPAGVNYTMKDQVSGAPRHEC